MPVPPQVRIPARDDYQVTEADRNLLLAARAHIRLAGLERMDPAHVHFGGVSRAGVHHPILAQAVKETVTARR
jgi:hypothetical protein